MDVDTIKNHIENHSDVIIVLIVDSEEMKEFDSKFVINKDVTCLKIYENPKEYEINYLDVIKALDEKYLPKPDTRTFRFYKELDNRWYADVPEWTGFKEELEMVSGADTMLDIIAQGESEVRLKLSTKHFDNSSCLKLLREDSEIGGGHYVMEKYIGIEFNLELWLCEVTRFVLGCIPENIYIAKVKI